MSQRGKMKGNIEPAQPAQPGQTFAVGEATVRTTPAYNMNENFHPRENNCEEVRGTVTVQNGNPVAVN